MLTFKSLSLKDVVYFKQTDIDLNQNGITAIIGENRNTDMKGRRNGAGKSLLVSALAHLKYGDVHSSSRSTRHSLLDQDTSSISWLLDINGDNWEITKRKQGRTISWSMFKNGQDQEPRTAQIAEGIINQIIPWTEEEFYTSIYLDSRRPNFLQMGTSTARHSYFTELFRLNSFEGVKKYFVDINREMSDIQVKLDTYLEQNADLQWVEFFDKPGTLSEIDILKDKVQEKKDKLNSLISLQQDRKNYIKYKDIIESADKYDEQRHKLLKDQSLLWSQYEDYLQERKEYKEDLDIYNEDKHIAESLNIESQKDLQVRIKQLTNDQYNYEDRIDSFNRDSKKYRLLVKKKETHIKYLDQANKIKQRPVEIIEHELSQVDKEIKQLKIHKKGHCDKCGSTLDKDAGKKRLKRLEKKRNTLINDYGQSKEKANLLNLAGQWSEDNENELRSLSSLSKPEEPDTCLLDKLEGLNLIPPKKPKKMAKPYMGRNKVIKGLKDQQIYREHKLIIQELRSSIERGKNIENNSDLINKCSKGIERLEDKIFTLKQDIRDHEKDSASYGRLLKKIDRLRRKLEDKPLVEALIGAYSPKGLKVFVMKNLAEKIESNLNTFSHLLFPELFTFSIDIEQNVFTIQAIRGDKVSDIKYLSGAESRAFSLLWMISILPLIPDDRRSNLIVLDEITSGLDEPTTGLLINKFLPKLNELVPHIIFITPTHANYPVVNRTIKVIKEQNYSTLEHLTAPE